MKERYGLWSFALLWGFAAALAWWRGGFAAWFLFYAGAAILLYAGAVWMLTRHGVSLERSCAAAGYAGDDVEVTITVRRRMWIPPAWLVIRDGMRHGATEALLQNKQLYYAGFSKVMQFTYLLPALPRGEYTFEPVELFTGDALGLFIRRDRYALPGTIRMYARPLPIEDWNPLYGAQEGVPVRGRLEDGGGFAGARPYAEGDPLSRVHWKLSAKSGGLMSRLDEPANYRMMRVVLDGAAAGTGTAALRLFESCVQVAASVMQWSQQHRQLEALLAVAADIAPPAAREAANSGRSGQARSILDGGSWQEALCRVKCSPAEEAASASMLADWLVRAGGCSGNDALTVCITSRLSERLVQAMRHCRSSQGGMAVIYVHSSAMLDWHARQVKAALEQAGCRFYSVPRARVVPPGSAGGMSHGA